MIFKLVFDEASSLENDSGFSAVPRQDSLGVGPASEILRAQEGPQKLVVGFMRHL